MTSIVSSATSMATSAATSLASTASTSVASGTSGPTPSPTTTLFPAPGSGGSTSKSLLFFVALGFGVVFTNLWIIVGVKYCFRYNRRARLARDENGDPIDLNNLARPRRRREKKLMSMDEVNERFPLTKYKIWRATRQQQGLPAEGGVTAPTSRAGSIKEGVGLARVSSELPPVGDPPVAETSTAAPETTTVTAPAEDTSRTTASDTQDFASSAPAAARASIDVRKSHDVARASVDRDVEKAETSTAPTNTIAARQDGVEEEDEDEDDPIRTAVPAEMLMAPGDTCAICIDTLEDDDEVRGLTCGHAFHAGCLDPWLTSRRACCPLCKADYYVPKPRPEAEVAAEEGSAGRRPRRGQAAGDNTAHRHSVFARPSSALFDSRRFSMPMLFRRQQPDEPNTADGPQADTQTQDSTQPSQETPPSSNRGRTENEQSRRLSRFGNLRLPQRRQGGESPIAEVSSQQESEQPPAVNEPAQQTRRTNWIRRPRFFSRNNTNQDTPGQLEAGTQS